jgi:hypothetical protein
MKFYDVFNGDADGLCALHQLRLAEPRDAVLVTGTKRDIELLARVDAGRGDEITVLRRDPTRGTVATRLDQTPGYAARASVYDNGELWVRHCDGDQEAPLFAGMAR